MRLVIGVLSGVALTTTLLAAQEPELCPLHPANGVGLGSPTASATTTPPFPWEAAVEPTPTPFPHPELELVTQARPGGQRRWIESRRLSVRGVVRGCQTLEAGGTDPVPRGGAAQLAASVHGLILMNAFHTSEDVNNSDVPQFVLPLSTGPSRSTSSATVRQSRVTVTAVAPEFAGGALTGELDVDFFGGQQPSTGGRTFPLLRIRKAFAALTWTRFAVLAGQESPLIADVSPSSIASIGFPEFAGSGNLWLWIPQLRVSADLPPTGAIRLGAEVAALAPTSGEPQGSFLTQPDAAERSDRPYLQGRVRGRWGAGESEGEVSFGGHYGWLMDSTGGRISSKALTVSVWTPLAAGFELRGEAFTGQVLAGLGGGGIGQNMVRNGVPVETKGGWVQLNYRAGSWELGAGGGIDDPDDDDLVASSRLRNTTFEGHVIWRHQPAVVGLTGRGIRTR